MGQASTTWETRVHPYLSFRGLRAVFGFILLTALCGALLVQRTARHFPQAYAEAVLASEDLFGLVTEALETGIWILFNLMTPPA